MRDKNNIGFIAIIITIVLGFWGMNANMNARFDAMNHSINARFDAVYARFDAVDARFDTVNARIDDLRRELSVKIDQIGQMVDENDRRLTALEG